MHDYLHSEISNVVRKVPVQVSSVEDIAVPVLDYN